MKDESRGDSAGLCLVILMGLMAAGLGAGLWDGLATLRVVAGINGVLLILICITLLLGRYASRRAGRA